MAHSADKVLAKLATLDDSLDDLEEKLEPLLAQTLPESLLSLETIQQAKLNVALPYLVYDLIFIYLKTRGIDPKSHPVVAELDRVRQYFDKIKNAEDPEKRKTAVDRAAANRFIKHAIAQVKGQPQQRTPGEAPAQSDGPPTHTHIRFDENGNAPSGPSSASSSTLAAQIPVKVTSKMLARAEYQKKLAEGDASSDDDDADALEVIDGESETVDGAEPERTSSKAKGKAKATGEEDVTPRGATKRRRPASDPFAGYGDDIESKPTKTSKKKVASQESASSTDVAMADGPDPVSGTGTPTGKSSNKDKNAAKKAKKKAKKAS
ncbi:Sas10/Utp3/C1D family-domain-containing protein [Ganoderma leucocontextum]|nr:Sas10/Utp3/C1D family-domain-containing protein [Ganoderma leucocontextum]